jgi:hypothetical protein
MKIRLYILNLLSEKLLHFKEALQGLHTAVNSFIKLLGGLTMKKLFLLIAAVCVMLSSVPTCYAASYASYKASSLKFIDQQLIVEGWFYNGGNTTVGGFTDVVISVFDKNDTLIAKSTFNDYQIESIILSPGQGKKWTFFIPNKTPVDISKYRVECKCDYKSYSTQELEKGVKVYYKGSKIKFDVAPRIENGRALVPMRAIFEAMGATVQWKSSTNTAIARRGDTEIKLVINSYIAYVNGYEVFLDVPAKIVDGRTLVPARFISEALGCVVTWGEADSMVGIYE